MYSPSFRTGGSSCLLFHGNDEVLHRHRVLFPQREAHCFEDEQYQLHVLLWKVLEQPSHHVEDERRMDYLGRSDGSGCVNSRLVMKITYTFQWSKITGRKASCIFLITYDEYILFDMFEVLTRIYKSFYEKIFLYCFWTDWFHYVYCDWFLSVESYQPNDRKKLNKNLRMRKKILHRRSILQFSWVYTVIEICGRIEGDPG